MTECLGSLWESPFETTNEAERLLEENQSEAKANDDLAHKRHHFAIGATALDTRY